MKKEPYYAFRELSDEAKKVAAELIKQKEDARKITPLILNQKVFNQEINDHIMTSAKERYSGCIECVDWSVTTQYEVIINEMEVDITEEQALARVDKTVRLAFNYIKVLTGLYLNVSHNHSAFWIKEAIKDYGASQAQMKKWLRFVRKNSEFAPVAFEQDWKDIRYQARVNTEENLEYWQNRQEISLISAVEYTGNRICEKVKEAYRAIYNEMEKEMTNRSQEIIDYYRSIPYYQNQLEKGMHEEIRYLANGLIWSSAHEIFS